MRQDDGHQVGAQRRVPRLPGLPGVPEHHELPARGGPGRPDEGGGGPDRRKVPRVRGGHGHEAGPLRALLRLHPVPGVQRDEVHSARRPMPKVWQRPLGASLAPGQDLLWVHRLPQV
ncbi:MAG TPA: hypothetical protein VMK42_07065 [Anaeromyxobacteraceae bacterium]|nr:hypothetical protein [Anaeromyxobacteraceae bacterium]